MSEIKSIKKCFCLVIGIIGVVLPVITHISLWSFGLMAGLGLAGWMLLPDKKENEETIIHAKWEMVVDDFDNGKGNMEYPHCSNCHTGVYRHDAKNYCPNCGAKMDKK